MVDHLTAAGSAGVAVMSAARQLGKRDQVVRASLKRVAIKGDDMRWRLRPGGADPDSPDPYVGTAGRAPVPITRPVPVRVDGTVPDGTRPATRPDPSQHLSGTGDRDGSSANRPATRPDRNRDGLENPCTVCHAAERLPGDIYCAACREAHRASRA